MNDCVRKLKGIDGDQTEISREKKNYRNILEMHHYPSSGVGGDDNC